MNKSTVMPNRLASEKSPYLLQHQYNPVNWYPWGEEAFIKAREEDKPIFLSIGYSTCHWCHVMEKESFEDDEVAKYMNEYFIAIKVDKEERPDIDSIYMNVCQKLTGSGGWPLTLFLMPNGEPFYAGTYFPKRSTSYMPGLLDLLATVKEKWNDGRKELEISASEITKALTYENVNREIDSITPSMIKKAAGSLQLHFDKEYGGFSKEPKFPSPHNLMFLLRYSVLYDNKESAKIVMKTLNSMYFGGIFDHIGYGFSRYSTDRRWLVPHFEKMLYDNGLLIISYLEAYQLTKEESYKKIAELTMEYVIREMMSSEGGFYCAQDADSDGIEGKYYIFTKEELLHLLGDEDGEYYCRYYGITTEGNFEGKSIPNRLHIKGDISNEFLDDRIKNLSKKVFSYRLERTKLHKDDKILASWNGIMMVAFSMAYNILGEKRYLDIAMKVHEFIENKLSNGNKLSVHFRDNVASGTGHIDDYAYCIWGLIELYKASFRPKYLKKALDLNKELTEHFFDFEEGGFYLYSDEGEQLIYRPKEIYDGAMPSGNSVELYNLIQLNSITSDVKLTRILNKHIMFMGRSIGDYPSAHVFGVMSGMLYSNNGKELICVVNDDNQIDEIKGILRDKYLPGLVTIIKTPSNEKELETIIPFIQEYKIEGKLPAFYLCENHSCKAPFYDVKELFDIISKL
jgi:uncharacterized protein YyaL (SSP411 family)